MVSSIYKKTFSVLMKRPFRLWGISLLAEFLCLVAYAGFIGVPAAAFCAALLLSASMSMIFLNSYRTGLEPKTSYLFASFKKDRILRVLGGMAWISSGSSCGRSFRSSGSCSASSVCMNTASCPTSL